MLAYFSITQENQRDNLNNTNYHPQYLKSVNRRDVVDLQAQNITLDLDDRVGNAVKLELYFENKWLILSEIQFDSELASDLDIISNNYHSEIIDNKSDQDIEDIHESIHDDKRLDPISIKQDKKHDQDISKQVVLSDTPERKQDEYKISDTIEITKGTQIKSKWLYLQFCQTIILFY